jgi:hypothetical protein
MYLKYHVKKLFSLLVILLICSIFISGYSVNDDVNTDLYVYCKDALYKVGVDESGKPIKEQILKPSFDSISNSFMLPPMCPPYFFTTKTSKINNTSYLPQINYPLISNDLNSTINFTTNTDFGGFNGNIPWIYRRDSKKITLLYKVFKNLGDYGDDYTIDYAWFSSIKDEIYYIITSNRKTDLWKTDLNFKNKVNLTKDIRNGLDNNTIILSPDSEKILFHSNYSLWLMNSDGTKKIDINKEMEKEFKDDSGYDINIEGAKFTPDSKIIIFNMSVQWREDGSVYDEEKSIWSISTDLNEEINLTKEMKDMVPYSSYIMSPDGNKIVFMAMINNEDSTIDNKNSDIWVINIDGSEKKNLTEGIEKEIGKYYGFQCFPFISISPDGNKVVFDFIYLNEKQDEAFYSLGVVNIDGTELKDLLKDAKIKYPELKEVYEFAYYTLAYFYPCFTPDSNNVVFVSYNGPDLWTVSNDGKNFENLSKKFKLKLWNLFLLYFVD